MIGDGGLAVPDNPGYTNSGGWPATNIEPRQWRNDGVAAASRDGGPTGKGAPDSSYQEFLMINF